MWRWGEIEVLKVDIFSNFLWFWGMAFSESFTTTWPDNFLGKNQTAVRRSRLLPKNSLKVGFQSTFRTLSSRLFPGIILHTHKIRTNKTWENCFLMFSFMKVSNIHEKQQQQQQPVLRCSLLLLISTFVCFLTVIAKVYFGEGRPGIGLSVHHNLRFSLYFILS